MAGRRRKSQEKKDSVYSNLQKCIYRKLKAETVTVENNIILKTLTSTLIQLH